jgi:glutamine synthetase
MLLAGLDGIKNKIEPVDKDLYELPPEEHASVPQVPTDLGAVLDALEADHDDLLLVAWPDACVRVARRCRRMPWGRTHGWAPPGSCAQPSMPWC